ncbi:Ser-Thr-rich glycosyl-phosphatidyl-inositol-anchored membrane family-domain-containing protein [Peziza echinospora]|nr:Ser-Thr-rich glycosyl-phosphatidyl-inositol-anchored membrane family-domain-containing protein [Peziza echinospora]
MRFFSTVFIALSAITSIVSAQVGSGNPISAPTLGSVLTAGATTTIAWGPTAGTGPITLTLKNGPENALNSVAVIATNIPNSGNFTWSIPQTTVAGTDYTIEIKWSSGQNYSPRFEIKSTFTSTRTTSTVSSTTSTSSATTSTVSSTITSAPNSTTTTMRTTTSARPTTTANNTGGGEIPKNAAGKSAVSSIGLIAFIACAMVFLA